MNNIKNIWNELKIHSPLTAIGAISGAIMAVVIFLLHVPPNYSESLFEFTHPVHVLLSAFATVAIFRRAHGVGFWKTIFIGYVGSVGICTLSDCVLPYLGEQVLGLPNSHIHLCFIEDWFTVNPLAFVGIGLGVIWHNTKMPHLYHVLISTYASLFHITMSMGGNEPIVYIIPISIFLFVSVLIPCCTSDIIFPLMFVECKHGGCGCKKQHNVDQYNNGNNLGEMEDMPWGC